MIPLLRFQATKTLFFCCNFDSTAQYAVSGGQDDTAFVWETATGNTKFECTGHSESVIAASFSHDSKYVATADMNGLIQVWEMESASQVWSFDCSEVTWLQWLHKENSLIVGSTDGTCLVKWNVPEGDTSFFPPTGFGTSAGCICLNDEKVAIGYSDGTVKLWNLKDQSLVGTVMGALGHRSSITSVKFHPDNALIVTGSEDGTAKLIRTSNCKVIWSISCCDSLHDQNPCQEASVESIEFCTGLSLILIGSSCGLLSFWDFSSQTKRFSSSLDSLYQAAIVKIICDNASLTVYVATAEGELQAFDVRSGLLKESWNGHQNAILDMALSRDGKYIVTSSDDHTCKIFEKPNS